MKATFSLFTALCVSISALPYNGASTLETRASSLTPTRPFTVSAFESPYPVGQGITGLNVTARGGNFYLSATAQKAVLFTTSNGRAYLNSKASQPLYIDTNSGALGYATPAPAGALFIDYLHRGHGDQIFSQVSGYVTFAPGDFQWIGSDNDGWFGCPKANGEYQVFKQMTPTVPDLSGCTEFEASALDYGGLSPAVDSYV